MILPNSSSTSTFQRFFIDKFFKFYFHFPLTDFSLFLLFRTLRVLKVFPFVALWFNFNAAVVAICQRISFNCKKKPNSCVCYCFSHAMEIIFGVCAGQCTHKSHFFFPWRKQIMELYNQQSINISLHFIFAQTPEKNL